MYMVNADYQKKKSSKTLPLSNDHGHTPEVRADRTSNVSIPDFSEKVNTSDENALRYSQPCFNRHQKDKCSIRFNSLLIMHSIQRVRKNYLRTLKFYRSCSAFSFSSLSRSVTSSIIIASEASSFSW